MTENEVYLPPECMVLSYTSVNDFTLMTCLCMCFYLYMIRILHIHNIYWCVSIKLYTE